MTRVEDYRATLRDLDDRARGSRFEQRVAVAALCEPPPLRDEAAARTGVDGTWVKRQLARV